MPHYRIARRLALIAVLVSAIAAAGCVPTRFGRTPEPATDFVAERVVVRHDFAFLPGETELDPARIAELDAFVAEVGIRPDDEVVVIGHGPYADQRARRVALALDALGVPGADLRRTAGAADRVTVAVARTVPVASACLVERHVRFGGSYALLPSPNCANMHNLARMVADPADLYGGRTLSPAPGALAGDAVRRYRAGEEEAIEVEVTGE